MDASKSRKVAAKWESLPVRVPRPKRQQQTVPGVRREDKEKRVEKEREIGVSLFYFFSQSFLILRRMKMFLKFIELKR